MEFPEEAIFMLTDVKSWLGPLTLVKCWDILSYHFTFSPEQLFPWTAALVWIWFTSSWPSGEISEKHPLSRSLASANPKGRMSSGSIWEPQPSLWLFCSLPIYCSHHCVGWVHGFIYLLILWFCDYKTFKNVLHVTCHSGQAASTFLGHVHSHLAQNKLPQIPHGVRLHSVWTASGWHQEINVP